MSSKHEKIVRYLQSNFCWTDPTLLPMWSSHLDHDRFSKLIKQKLVWTSQGSQEIGRHLTVIRKDRKPNFKIDLQGLLKVIPNDLIVFQNAKNNPLFPIIILQLYADNRNVYEAFHRRFPIYPREQQLNRLLQQDEYWVDKYRAGEFYRSDLEVHFRTTIPNTHIILFLSLSNNSPLFKAELKTGQQTLSTINCVVQDIRNIDHKKLSLLCDLVTRYDYDSSSFKRQISNELENFTSLVPEFVSQFTSIFVSETKIGRLKRDFASATRELKSGGCGDLSSVFINNLYSWPFRPL